MRIHMTPKDMKNILGEYFSYQALCELTKYLKRENLGELFPFEIVERYEEVDQAAAQGKNVIAFLPKGTVLVRK